MLLGTKAFREELPPLLVFPLLVVVVAVAVVVRALTMRELPEEAEAVATSPVAVVLVFLVRGLLVVLVRGVTHRVAVVVALEG